MSWNPLEWFNGKPASQQTVNVKAQPSRTNIVRSPGGKLGPTDGVTRIRTNTNVPGGGGISMGGLPGFAVYAAGDALIPHISREAVRGGLVVTGQDTTNFDRRNAGKPVVVNIGGVSYNITTPEGLKGAQEAKKRGEKPSAPAKPAEETAVPGAGQNYVGTGGVEYDYATGQAINPDTGKIDPKGYSIDKDGKRIDRSAPPPTPNPDGIEQTGTVTGGSRSAIFTMEDFQRDIGNPNNINIRNPFSSNNLPETTDHDSSIALTPSEIKADGGAPQSSDPVVKAGEEVDGYNGTTNNKADELDQDRTMSPKNSGINWAERSMADNSDARVRASRAFLDGKRGSMMALRAAEGEMGMARQGGKTLLMGKDGKGIEISDEGYRARMGGAEVNDEFLKKYSSAPPPAPAVAQNPDMYSGDGLQQVDTLQTEVSEAPTYTTAPVMSEQLKTGEIEVDPMKWFSKKVKEEDS